MTIYPLPESIADSHDGDEWAIAALMAGRVVALLYLSDVAPEIVGHLDTPAVEFVVKRWTQTAPDALLELQALGDVSAGTVTADGFEERWELAEWRPSDRLPEGSAPL